MDRAEIIARALHIARRQLKADGGSIADDFLPRLAPTPETAHNYGRAPIFDEYGQPHDPITGTKLESPDPSLSESLYNIATSPARVAVGAVTEPISAAGRLPYETLTGVPEIDVRAKNDALALLSALYGGNAFNPLARMPANSIGMFAGRMAKTADQDALAHAEAMEASGLSRGQIWDSTGWFKGPDDKWRFEIDDSGSRWQHPRDLVPAQSVNGPTANALSHSSLMEAYPDVANLPMQYVRVAQPPPGSPLGSYRPGQGVVVREAGEFADPRSTALHELQHHIQESEGFARGSNPAKFTPAALKSEMFEDYSRSIQDLMGRDPDAASLYRQRNQIQSAQSGTMGPWSDDAIKRFQDIEDQLSQSPTGRQLLDLDWDRTASQHYSDDYWKNMALDRYRKSAGEVEARNVQKRMNMTPDERRSIPPWETQDVPFDQQIVKFR